MTTKLRNSALDHRCLKTELTKNPENPNCESLCFSFFSLYFFFNFYCSIIDRWASLVVLMVKNPPVMQKTRVPSLGQEDLLQEGMATHSSVLAWRISWTKEPDGLWSIGLQRVGHD